MGGVVVNGVIRTADPSRAPEFVRNRMAMQEGYLGHIRQEFEDRVRGVLYDDDIRGVSALRQAAKELFA